MLVTLLWSRPADNDSILQAGISDLLVAVTAMTHSTNSKFNDLADEHLGRASREGGQPAPATGLHWRRSIFRCG